MSVLASGISVVIFSIMGIEHALIVATFIGMATGFFTAHKDESDE